MPRSPPGPAGEPGNKLVMTAEARRLRPTPRAHFRTIASRPVNPPRANAMHATKPRIKGPKGKAYTPPAMRTKQITLPDIVGARKHDHLIETRGRRDYFKQESNLQQPDVIQGTQNWAESLTPTLAAESGLDVYADRPLH